MKNTDPNAQATWQGYGCVRCQVVHFEGSPLYKQHLTYQSKHGIRAYSAEERSQHLTASDQSVEETPQEDIRNALTILAVAERDPQGRCTLTPEEYHRIGQRLQAAVAKLERVARQERPYRKEPQG